MVEFSQRSRYSYLAHNCPPPNKPGCGPPDDASGAKAKVDEGDAEVPSAKSRPKNFGNEEKLIRHYENTGRSSEFRARRSTCKYLVMS